MQFPGKELGGVLARPAFSALGAGCPRQQLAAEQMLKLFSLFPFFCKSERPLCISQKQLLKLVFCKNKGAKHKLLKSEGYLYRIE